MKSILVTIPILGFLFSMASASTWTESSFEDFSDGTFLDAGSNLYVSANGRIQMISRWDLNGDGNLDILMPAGRPHRKGEYLHLPQPAAISMRVPGSNCRATVLNRDLFTTSIRTDTTIRRRHHGTVTELTIPIYYGAQRILLRQPRRTAVGLD
jgi:hypothetical protein